jgi:hypothetical protein
MNREQIDKMAWQTIHDRPPLPISEDRGWRARDYQELEAKLKAGVDFEHAWSDFLHAFYDYRTSSFIVHPSPASLTVEWQALLAGAAEWLSAEFGLPHPVWTDQPQYFLSEPWDPLQDRPRHAQVYSGQVMPIPGCLQEAQHRLPEQQPDHA